MKHIVIDKSTGQDASELRESPSPELGLGEVSTRVKTCAVNFAGGILWLGLSSSARKLHGYQITPGFDAYYPPVCSVARPPIFRAWKRLAVPGS